MVPGVALHVDRRNNRRIIQIDVVMLCHFLDGARRPSPLRAVHGGGSPSSGRSLLLRAGGASATVSSCARLLRQPGLAGGFAEHDSVIPPPDHHLGAVFAVAGQEQQGGRVARSPSKATGTCLAYPTNLSRPLPREARRRPHGLVGAMPARIATARRNQDLGASDDWFAKVVFLPSDRALGGRDSTTPLGECGDLAARLSQDRADCTGFVSSPAVRKPSCRHI